MYKQKEINDLKKQVADYEHLVNSQNIEIENLRAELEHSNKSMVITSDKNVSINPEHVLYLFLDRRGVRSEDDEECLWHIVAMFKGGYTAVLEKARGRTAAEKEMENLSIILLR